MTKVTWAKNNFEFLTKFKMAADLKKLPAEKKHSQQGRSCWMTMHIHSKDATVRKFPYSVIMSHTNIRDRP